MKKYIFSPPLREGVILKRNSRFTMQVDLDGKIVNCHCPTTGRIGDIEMKNIACLLSESADPNRKTPYTVEAISADNVAEPCKNWVGINQILSNRLVEFFLSAGQLECIVGNNTTVRREVKLGNSKLDFLVGNTYLEVKTSLNTLQVVYGSDVAVKPVQPFSSTDRFVKHIGELAASLREHERAIMLTVYQYEITQRKQRLKSTHSDQVASAVASAIDRGVEMFEVSMRFAPDGVELLTCENITNSVLQG